jgi:hypothetical protein
MRALQWKFGSMCPCPGVGHSSFVGSQASLMSKWPPTVCWTMCVGVQIWGHRDRRMNEMGNVLGSSPPVLQPGLKTGLCGAPQVHLHISFWMEYMAAVVASDSHSHLQQESEDQGHLFLPVRGMASS